MFLGQYQHTIDNKGRLTIPSRYRELLAADGAYVTLGFDRNLMVLTSPVFEEVSERVSQMNLAESRARLLKRLIFSSAVLVEMDRAGRILVPEFLRQAVDLASEAIIVGAGQYFEIWSPTNWSKQLEQIQDADANADRFSVLDLSI
jgi:MraZ protein